MILWFGVVLSRSVTITLVVIKINIPNKLVICSDVRLKVGVLMVKNRNFLPFQTKESL